jgi:aldose 1-epimerase
MSITSQSFGSTKNGEPVTQYTLRNRHGLSASVITFGATLTQMHTPDRKGNFADVTLGFDDITGYNAPSNPYFGATVGRFANRLAKGRFSLNGKDYQLLVNNGANHLHGGGAGSLCWKNWSAKIIDEQSVAFSVVSPDGEEGYPGRLELTVTYSLTDNNELRLDYHANTDQDTIINFTNHAYWNLAGHDSGNVHQHHLQVFAEKTLVRNEACAPTGELRSVKGTPLDFTLEKTFAPSMHQVEDVKDTLGLDHAFVLAAPQKEPTLAAIYKEPNSGRQLEVLTTETSLQIYTAGFVENLTGKNGAVYQQHQAVCLETQNFPDAPNHANFPSAVLKKGDIYRSTTVHRFSAK